MLISALRSLVARASKISTDIWLLILLPATLALSCRPRPQPEKPVQATPTPQAAVIMRPMGIPEPVPGKPYPGTGVVTFINLKEGWVEIKHEEIKGLMPAMTMEFWAKPRSIMKRARVGDKVDFVIIETSKGEFVTKLERVAPVR